jgi:hypothetical protein
VRLVSRAPFAGVELDQAHDTIERVCRAIVPAPWMSAADSQSGLIAYSLWRFTSACASEIAAAVGITTNRFADLVRQMRQARLEDLAWHRMLRAVEWALRWRLRAAPHRP